MDLRSSSRRGTALNVQARLPDGHLHNMTRRTLFQTLASAALAWWAGSWSVHAQVVEPERTSAEVRRGEHLYRQHCEVCHGIAMNAGSSGAFDLRAFPPGQKVRFVRSVSNGKNGMPPWRGVLDPSEIEALYAYVTSEGVR